MKQYYLITAIQESQWFNVVTEMEPEEWLIFWKKQIPTTLIVATSITESNFKALKEIL
jgi:hypothetical protein